MLNNLLSVILVGGLPVLWSYFIISQQTDRVKQHVYVPEDMIKFWYFSMVITVVSYFILAYTFVWALEDGKMYNFTAQEAEPYLCLSYVLFLAFAGQWAYCVLLDVEYGRKSLSHQVNLYCTAIFSIVLMVSALGIHGIGSTLLGFTYFAGVWLAFHHLIIDAIIWYYKWDPEYFA